MTANYGTSAGRAPGSIFSGNTIAFPGRYEGMSSQEMTLTMLKADNHVEWFSSAVRGRREGEEETFVVTRHDVQAGTSISANIPRHLMIAVDMEDIKRQLRDAHARREAEADEPKI